MKYITTLVILFNIYSCKHEPNMGGRFIGKSAFTLTEKDTVSFPISVDTNYFSWYTQVLKQGNQTYLCRLEYFQDAIEIYNFETTKLEKRIILKTEGPNSVRNLQGGTFHFYTKDSFLFANSYSEIFLMKNDSVLKKNRFIVPISNSVIFGDNSRKMVVVDNEIFLRHVSYLDAKTEKFSKSSILFKYNLLTNQSDLCNISLHKNYSDSKYLNMNPNFKNSTYTFNDKTKRFIISYTIFTDLYEYEIKQDMLLTEHNVRIDNTDTFSIPTKKNMSSKESFHHYLSNVLYHEIIYDKYRDIYYRFISLPIPEYKLSIEEPYLHKPYKIMVLDNEFKVITIREFPQYRFHVKDWFINEDGLWLSNNNPNNPIFNENNISFTLLKVESNE